MSMLDEFNERRAAIRAERLAEMCEHMKALIEHCNNVEVRFGGCGECGSAWLTCKTCDSTVDLAHEAFE